eukprot:UN03904
MLLIFYYSYFKIVDPHHFVYFFLFLLYM